MNTMRADNISVIAVQDATLAATSLIRDEVVAFFSARASKTSNIDQTLELLFRYLLERCKAVSFVVSHGFSWDAEIILRSFYEAAAKILFICHTEPQDRTKLVEEFWRDLGVVTNRRLARHASFITNLKGQEDPQVADQILRIFGDKDIFNTSSDKPKSQRKSIEEKWSFSGILDQLNEILPSRERIDARVLLHSYGMGSHLIHADGCALDLIRLGQGDRICEQVRSAFSYGVQGFWCLDFVAKNTQRFRGMQAVPNDLTLSCGARSRAC